MLSLTYLIVKVYITIIKRIYCLETRVLVVKFRSVLSKYAVLVKGSIGEINLLLLMLVPLSVAGHIYHSWKVAAAGTCSCKVSEIRFFVASSVLI